jgi:hypothetical protein
LVFRFNALDDLIDADHGLFFLDALRKTVADEQGLVLLKLEHGEDLTEGEVNGVAISSAAREIGFLSAFGISLNGWFGLLDHVMMCALALLLFPLLHYFIVGKMFIIIVVPLTSKNHFPLRLMI